MDLALEAFNNMAGAAALVNGLILWPIVRSLQRTVNEMKKERETENELRNRRTRRRRAR